MKFSILTPSHRQFPWLRRCIRSVADQPGVEIEHLIQDTGHDPDLATWARQQSTVHLAAEPDTGMYHALNKALSRATGDIIGLLNSDEQYLPGTLAKVARAFAENPEADLVAGDYLVVDPEQQLLAFRKVTPLREATILTDHLYAFTCALFIRRSVFADVGPFDESFRSVADADWVARALHRGHRAVLLPEYLATFTWTGENLSAQAISREEELRLRAKAPPVARLAAPLLRTWRHVERWMAGGYHSRPIRYEVYLHPDSLTRTQITCEHPSYRYPCG